MIESTLKTVINAPAETVWELVTNPEKYGWRSDIEKAVTISPECFEEHTSGGYVTRFAVTLSEPCRRWELDMENSDLKGHWVGIFSEIPENEGSTRIEFTESITVKNIFMKPFAKRFLKKQQERFASDLKKAVMKKSADGLSPVKDF